jgi:hypothetical protein
MVESEGEELHARHRVEPKFSTREYITPTFSGNDGHP